MTAPLPPDEDARMTALRKCNIVDSEAERDRLKSDLRDAQGKIRVRCGLTHDGAD